MRCALCVGPQPTRGIAHHQQPRLHPAGCIAPPPHFFLHCWDEWTAPIQRHGRGNTHARTVTVHTHTRHQQPRLHYSPLHLRAIAAPPTLSSASHSLSAFPSIAFPFRSLLSPSPVLTAAAAMSAPVTSVGDTTSAQAEVMKYLDSHHINDQLNVVINKLVKAHSQDPFGFLSREFLRLAKPATISRLVGREILDSRGNPTVEADVYIHHLDTESLIARQGAPSGASTGSNEAHELRDGDKARFAGKGTQNAANNVSTALSQALQGKELSDLRALDDAMRAADGTELKTKLGGNAITAASFAVADAGAELSKRELFLHLADAYWGASPPAKYFLPRPMVNILNGGKHAGGDLMVQEFMIVPRPGRFRDNLRMVAEVYHALAKILVQDKGPSAKNLGDEGGYAPALTSPDETLTYIERAIVAAGYKVGEDVFLALDAAASEFYRDGKYEVEKGKQLTSTELLHYWDDLVNKHPALISIEDGFDEKDYDGWTAFTAHFASTRPAFMIVGDDLYTTNTNLIRKGIDGKWANALLLKVNQIGTISESMDAARMIFEQKGNVIVSHRSGETPSAVISDLAVAIGAQFIKTGATARGERIAKYNRLLAIEEYLEKNGLL